MPYINFKDLLILTDFFSCPILFTFKYLLQIRNDEDFNKLLSGVTIAQ